MTKIPQAGMVREKKKKEQTKNIERQVRKNIVRMLG